MKPTWLLVLTLSVSNCNAASPSLESTKTSEDARCEKSCDPPLQLDASTCSCKPQQEGEACSACGEWVTGDLTPAADSVCVGTLFEQTQQKTRECPPEASGCATSETVAKQKDVVGTKGKTEEQACTASDGSSWDGSSCSCDAEYHTWKYSDISCTGQCTYSPQLCKKDKSCQASQALDLDNCACIEAGCTACASWQLSSWTPSPDAVCRGEVFKQQRTMTRTCPAAQEKAGCEMSKTFTSNREMVGTKGESKREACEASDGLWINRTSKCNCGLRGNRDGGGKKTFAYSEDQCRGGCN